MKFRTRRPVPRLAVTSLLLAAAAPAIAIAAVPRTSLQASDVSSSAAGAGCVASKPTTLGPPAWVVGCHIGGQGFTSPVVGTIDGRKVVVDASLSGWVYVVNALTGTEMPGWPRPADLVGKTPTAIDSSPAIAYLDGPGKEPSIVVGLGSQYVKDQNGGVMAWNANGTVRFKFRTKKTFAQWRGAKKYSNSVFATPAIGDITGNGQEDVVFGSFDHYVYALGPNGRLLKGFPVQRADTIWSSPALVDTTHTGKMDIIEGGDASGWTGPSGKGRPCYSGWVSDYRYEAGAPRLVWQRCLAETVWSSPAVTTFGSTPVVVVGTSWFYGPGRHTEPAEHELFAFNAENGKTMRGWPVNVGGASFGSPAVGPARPGEANEIVESSCADCLKGPAIVTAWTESGHRKWRTDLTLHSQVLASPAIADVTGGAWNDVLIGNVAGLFVLNAQTGKKVAGTGAAPINPSCNVGGTAAFSAVPGSKTGYMMFTNCGFNGPSRPADEFLRGYNVPAPAGYAPWPMFRANAQRTGVEDPDTTNARACRAPSTPAGYLVVTAAGAVRTSNGEPNCGDLHAELLPENVAGAAATPSAGGYWLVLGDGSVYAFGNAVNYGDLRGDAYRGGPSAPGAPIVAMTSSSDGKGYLLLAGDGSVYAFGDASYDGSRGDYHSSGAPVGIATDRETGGYWVVTSTGRVYGFDAPNEAPHGAAAHGRIIGIAADAEGNGFWLANSDGTVFAYGAAPAGGSRTGVSLAGIAATPSGSGYYLVTRTGAVYPFRVSGARPSAALRGEDVVAIASP